MKWLFGITSFLLASAAMAEPFVGPSVSVGIGSSSNSVHYSGFVNADAKKNSTASDVAFNYGIGTDSNWVIGVGGSIDLSKRKFGTVSYQSSGTQTVDAKMKQHYSVFVTPGYKVQPNLLVYGKLAYHWGKGEYRDSATDTGTRSHHGTGIGVGVSYALDNGIELGGEIQQIRFSAETAHLTTGKPKTTEAMFRIGYRF